jgi:hypothetical protein
MSDMAVRLAPFREAEARRAAAQAERTRPPLVIRLTDEQHAMLRRAPRWLLNGLRILRDGPPPPVARPDLWEEIVHDAVRFVADGWAEVALKDGWEPLELYGCAAAPEGDEHLLGVCARLASRRVIRVSTVGVTVATAGAPLVLARRRLAGKMVYLWEYGR